MRATGRAITGLGFPESLRRRDGALWFSDMFRGRVIRWAPGTEPEVVLDADSGGPAMPGGLGWLPDGDLLVVDCLERRVLRVRDGSVSVHADLSRLMAHPANDMHVDGDGTAWVGGYGFDPEADPPRATRLARVDPSGSIEPWGDGLVFPNGCERAANGDLIVAETFADRISRLSPEGERTTDAELTPGSGPDGLSIGDDGVVRVALAFTGEVVALVDGGATVVYRAGASEHGGLGCYDCAVDTDAGWMAVATASLDEALAERVDTGAVVLVPLT